MDEKELTEMEKVLKKTVEKQSNRIANLTLDLDLAHSQIEILQEKEHREKESKEENA